MSLHYSLVLGSNSQKISKISNLHIFIFITRSIFIKFVAKSSAN